jgi:hypothetical protein
VPEPVDLHGRINSHGAQPIGSPLPAYRNQAKQAWQVADAQRRRAERAETRLGRILTQICWTLVIVVAATAAVTWTIALAVLR